MQRERIKLWVLLIAVAAIPRVLGAFFLPNTFGDAYVYIRDIGALSTKIKSGRFALTDLYGFWLPLYQFLSAIANVFVGNGFYTGKVSSALCGTAVCLLVYAITLRLVQHQTAALLSFLLIALNPLHIMNSASAMTDIPHALLVLASLYFVLKKQWIVAAIFAALAGLTRVESWMLIAFIPAIQFRKERRVSMPAILIMLISPLFWFWVSWRATGDWLACFKTRDQYKDWLLTQNPALAEFSLIGVLKDGAMLLSGIDPAVLLAAMVAGFVVLKRFTKNTRPDPDADGGLSATSPEISSTESILPLLVFFFPFLALLVVAYATHQQPIIFPRYGLILFSLGIPILVWTYFSIARRRPQWSRRILVGVFVLCGLNAVAQFVGGVGELNRYRTQRRVADYLRTHFDVNSGGKIFCDEGTVRVLSGIPPERFIASANVPNDHEGFWSTLESNKVEWLILTREPGSIPSQLFPWVEYGERIGPYQSVLSSHSQFLRTNIWIYRIQNREL